MQTNKFAAWLSTFIVCFLFWMLLVWSVAPRELVLGVVVAAIIAWLSGGYFIHGRPFFMFNPVRFVTLVIYCVIIFLWEVIKANLSMAAIVINYDMKDYQAGIIRVPGSDQVKSDAGLFMVSNSITLTPGTITMDVAEDEDGKNYYYIHWIDVAETDREKAGEIIKGTMEKWIGRIWK